MKLMLLSVLLMFVIGCSEEQPKPKIDPAWAGVLDPQEQQDFARLKFYGPTGTDDNIRYTEYQYRVGYFSNRTLAASIAEWRELARLQIAVSAIGDSALKDSIRLRYLELQAFYGRYSDLSREESKELARMKLTLRTHGDLPEKTTNRFRDLSYRAEAGLRTAE